MLQMPSCPTILGDAFWKNRVKHFSQTHTQNNRKIIEATPTNTLGNDCTKCHACE